jgi:multiple sugar transport system ATP-binding protein
MAEIDFDNVTKVFGGGRPAVDGLSLHINDGEFMVLVGPSGCGKTTALRMLAGLEEISSGTLKIGGAIVNNALPKDRDVAMVFQNYALYPHMSVEKNIGFALKVRGDSKSEIKRKVTEAAAILHLEDYLDRRPKALSGGQRQRVAMGRAIVRSPQAFLMDEPLSNLDAKLRVEMRLEIARIQRLLNVATVYVTHDQVEAMTMGDRVAVMKDGQLQQVDTPQDLYDRPANEFVAGFMGSPPMNLLPCQLRPGADRVEVHFGEQVIELPLSYVNSHDLPAAGANVVLGVRPEDVLITDAGVTNTFKARVERSEALGSEILVHLSHTEALDRSLSPGERLRQDISQRATLIAKLGPRTKVTAGDVLSVQISSEHAHFFDAQTGETLRKRSS